ncbi:YueI family protein [Streptococcus gallolyticus]|nr:YueI family protein [Streptococcus gallolyticus]MBY5041113.1 YueI family protein [Streptococcus gallolyticus]
MTDLNNLILQKSSGENRINPDEQRYYMGTFRERVVLVVEFADATETNFQKQFTTICDHYLADYSPLTLKLSPKLTDRLQISYIKIAQEKGLTVSIIDEKIADSPFALLLHTDHAVNLENIDLANKFIAEASAIQSPEKVPLWKKLFSK